VLTHMLPSMHSGKRQSSTRPIRSSTAATAWAHTRIQHVSSLTEPTNLRSCVAALADIQRCKSAAARAELAFEDVLPVEAAESAWTTTVVSALRGRAGHLDFVSVNVLKNDLRTFARVPASNVTAYLAGIDRKPAGGCGSACTKKHHHDGLCLVCGKSFADHVGDGHRCKGACCRCRCC
jgi:hypothetical protein